MASTARRVVSSAPSSIVLGSRRGTEISFRYSRMICCMTAAAAAVVVSRLPFEQQNFAVRHVVLSSLSKASGRRELCPGKRTGGHKCSSGDCPWKVEREVRLLFLVPFFEMSPRIKIASSPWGMFDEYE